MLLVIEYSYPNKRKQLFHKNFFCWKYISWDQFFYKYKFTILAYVCWFLTQIKFWLQEESINILQGSRFQWIFSWKWKHAYLCNIHNLTSQFVKGFIVTGYLHFERNYLKIFIQVSVCYVFSIFYSIFIICIFVAFCCIQSVAFCRFLVPFKRIFQHFYHVQPPIFLPFFLSVSWHLFVATCLSFFCPFHSVSPTAPFVIL